TAIPQRPEEDPKTVEFSNLRMICMPAWQRSREMARRLQVPGSKGNNEWNGENHDERTGRSNVVLVGDTILRLRGGYPAGAERVFRAARRCDGSTGAPGAGA